MDNSLRNKINLRTTVQRIQRIHAVPFLREGIAFRESSDVRPLERLTRKELKEICKQEGANFIHGETYDIAEHTVQAETQRFICLDCNHRVYPGKGLHASEDEIFEEFATVKCLRGGRP